MAKRISQRMDDLRSFPHLAEMIDFPSLNCHKLRGDRQEEWAIKISANYRLIFELDHHPLPINEDGVLDTKAVTDICVIEIVDYH